jgi:CTP:molybdopterin cytidylyltransferase MocA
MGGGVLEGDTISVVDGVAVPEGMGVEVDVAADVGVGLAVSVALGVMAAPAMRRLVTTPAGHAGNAPARPRPDTFGLGPVS